MLTWRTRHEAETKEQALEALLDVAKSEYETIIGEFHINALRLKDTISEYVACWGIPFNSKAAFKGSYSAMERSLFPL